MVILFSTGAWDQSLHFVMPLQLCQPTITEKRIEYLQKRMLVELNTLFTVVLYRFCTEKKVPLPLKINTTIIVRMIAVTVRTK